MRVDPLEIKSKGFEYKRYYDGSFGLYFLREGTEVHAFNERLNEKKLLFPSGSVMSWIGMSATATTLNFETYPYAPLRQDMREGRDFLCIHGDLERSHLPQRWARDVMPVFGVRRLELFEETQNGDVLKYDQEKVDVEAAIRSYIALIASGWGFPTSRAMEVFDSLGFVSTAGLHDEEIASKVFLAFTRLEVCGFLRSYTNRRGDLVYGRDYQLTREELSSFMAELAKPFEDAALHPLPELERA